MQAPALFGGGRLGRALYEISDDGWVGGEALAFSNEHYDEEYR